MSRFATLRDVLEQEGWGITPVDQPNDCWWALEIWRMRSRWTPVGAEVFVSLLVDPGSIGPWTETEVRAVGVTREVPRSRRDAEMGSVRLRPDMSARIREIVVKAEQLRNEED